MSDHTHDISNHRKIYITVGVILLIGTLCTFALDHFDSINLKKKVGMLVATLAALAIATVKGGFVAGVFMHLSNEKKWVYWVMGITIFCVLGLMGLTLWGMNDIPGQGHQFDLKTGLPK